MSFSDGFLPICINIARIISRFIGGFFFNCLVNTARITKKPMTNPTTKHPIPINKHTHHCNIGMSQGAYPGILFQRNPEYCPPVWPEEPGVQQQMAHLDFSVVGPITIAYKEPIIIPITK